MVMVPPSSLMPTMSSFAMPESARLIAFLKEYRVLECSCCSNVFGFQHKVTGALFCIGGCHEKSPTPTQTSNAILRSNFLMPAPTPVNVPSILTASAFGNGNFESGPVTSVSNVEKPKTVAAPAPISSVEKPAAALVRTVDTTDCVPKKREVPKPAPITIPVEKVEPPAPVPVVKPAVPSRPVWSSMKYSGSLLKPDASVTVTFVWSPVSFTVSAEADEQAVITLQEAVKAYANSASTLKKPPAQDEIVIGEYEGEFYRARVVKVAGDVCELVFIDFGDKKKCKFNEVYPITPELMKEPVYGMIVRLRLPNIEVSPALTLDEATEQLVYDGPFILDMSKKGPTPIPGDAESYEVRMWDMEKDTTLNEKITSFISKASRDWTPLTPEEQNELAYFLSISPNLRETKEIIETAMQEDLLERNLPNDYVFKLDNADFQYKIQDLLCIQSSLMKDVIDVEITSFKSLASITARPFGDPFDTSRDRISDNLNHWIESRSSKQMRMLQDGFVPEFDEMCIVKWPKWEEVYFSMERIQEKWLPEYIDEGRLDIFKRDYNNYAGKWFRAACASDTNSLLVKNEDGSQNTSAIVYEMFLVDLGKTTLVPKQNVYRMPHRFMIDCQTSMFLSLVLEDFIQYDDSDDEKWKYLLLPGLKIKIKVLWMVDEIYIVKLISPSEKEFEEHLRQPHVQEGIQKKQINIQNNQRERKVKQMSKIKGTFKINLEKVRAQEAEQEKLKSLLEKYAEIGRIHPDRILELRVISDDN